MKSKEKFVQFLKENTDSEQEQRIFFNLCNFIEEHGDGVVRGDFQRLRESGALSDDEEYINERITKAVELLKQFQEN